MRGVVKPELANPRKLCSSLTMMGISQLVMTATLSWSIRSLPMELPILPFDEELVFQKHNKNLSEEDQVNTFEWVINENVTDVKKDELAKRV